ncbi:MAG: hypothetical protein PHW69_08685, partial [Elusimicrobiaceae bacterium]|nr:hypothetical protein [Elusimicrobiaceae bacterium]
QMRSEPVHLYLALAVFIYCAGYTLITVRARYLYPVFAIVFAAGAGGVAALMRSRRIKPAFSKMIAALFAVSFLYVPFDNLKDAVYSGRGYYALSKKLFDRYGVSGNIASDGRWMETLYVTYWLNEFHRARMIAAVPVFRPRHDTGYPAADSRPPRYRGQLRPGASEAQNARELSAHRIDYLLIWEKAAHAPAGWAELTGGNAPVPHLRIYCRP